jgi:nucleoid DNA-binding protein
MAKIVQAVNAYGPRLDLHPTVGLDRVSELSAMRTGLNKSEVMMSMQEFGDVILYFVRDGTPVKLPGLGIFTPSIDREGNLSINFRADPSLKKGIETLSDYVGQMTHRENIGIDNAKYKALWDADHPDDPLEI